MSTRGSTPRTRGQRATTSVAVIVMAALMAACSSTGGSSATKATDTTTRSTGSVHTAVDISQLKVSPIPAGKGLPEASATVVRSSVEGSAPKLSTTYSEHEYLMSGVAATYSGTVLDPKVVAVGRHAIHDAHLGQAPHRSGEVQWPSVRRALQHVRGRRGRRRVGAAGRADARSLGRRLDRRHGANRRREASEGLRSGALCVAQHPGQRRRVGHPASAGRAREAGRSVGPAPSGHVRVHGRLLAEQRGRGHLRLRLQPHHPHVRWLPRVRRLPAGGARSQLHRPPVRHLGAAEVRVQAHARRSGFR